jgi:DNA modification methylase
VVIRLLSGDCRDVLATLPADSVQCVVTSPPYYGLRDYQTAQWDGGDAACDHQQNVSLRRDSPGGFQNSTSRGTQASTIAVAKQYADTCGKCGAVRVDRQIGLEATPDEYLATMVGVFREVKRVLRRDGTCWVNMGDSYNANQGSGFNGNAGKPTASPKVYSGLAPKQLLMMPARLALALQADGWWLRSAIVWAKPNPMPESVTDRPTSAYEMVYLLTKNARYFYDNDAVREQHQDVNVVGGSYVKNALSAADYEARKWTDRSEGLTRPPMTMRDREYNPAGRNLRNVWTIATAPYSEAHFATFPPALAERCIKAGTSERGCCSQCGKPWVRTIERGEPDKETTRGQQPWAAVTGQRDNAGGLPHRETTTTGWRAGCDHNADAVPCVVLDPFAGAGTTLLVADRLQRDAIGIELNTTYTEMAMERCRADAPLFVDVPAADPEDERMADLFAEAAE